MADVNVLVIGSDTDSSSYTTLYNDGVASVSAFDPADVVSELTSILGGAGLGTVNVTFEDLNGVSTYLHVNLFSWFHFPFPLADPDVQTNRWADLRGEDGTVWDYVVLIGDAHSMEYLPGFYALGVSEIAKEVAKGSAETVLLMPWPASGSSTTLDHYKEVVYRVGRSGGCAVAPAGLAWDDSGESSGASHPTSNGAYIAAATLYSRLFGASASTSTYGYGPGNGNTIGDALADSAHATVQANQGAVQYTGKFDTPNPYSAQYNTNRNVGFSITGTSTERGHIDALEKVLDACRVGHSKYFSHRYNTDNPDTEGAGWPTDEAGDFIGPIDYNFGKFHFYTYEEYNVNPNFWKHTYIFEYQQAITEDTALGLILNHDMEAGADAYMLSPTPGAIGATIPRASWAMLYRLKPSIEMNGSGNHLTEIAIMPNATFINTVDSGRCPLTPEVASPTDEWDAMRVGYEAGWIMSTLQARAPGFRVLPSAADKQEINNYDIDGTEDMTVQFIFEPQADVTVNLSSSNPSLITISPSTLTFTPGNHDVAQSYTVSIAGGVVATEEEISVNITTTSTDEVYHDLSDSWTYTAKAAAAASLPVAVADAYRVGVNDVLTEAVATGVTANDITNPLSPITQVTVMTNVSDGTLNLSSDGSFTYTPDTDFEGEDSFTYIATNTNGSSAAVTVVIAVSDLDPSLILWYEFEDANIAKDSTAYGRDGTINSSVPQVAGVATGTFGVDLNSGTVDIPIDQEFYDLLDDEISIAFWSYIDPVDIATATSNSYLLRGTKTYDGITYDSLSLRFQTKMVDDEYNLFWENGIYTQGSTGSTTGNPGMYRYKLATADSSLTPSDINDQWVHWTFTRDRVSGFFRIYKDGALVAQNSSAGLYAMGLIDEMDDLVLGNSFKGNVDDLRIYNRELAVSEIADIMVESNPPDPQTWTGSAVDDFWSTAGNWSLGTAPEAGSTLGIDTTDVIDVSSAASFPSLSTITLTAGTLEIGASAKLALQSGSVLTVNGGSITRGSSVTSNVTIGVNGESSLLDISSGSIQFIAGDSAATPIYSDLTIRGGDIDIEDSQTRIYGALTIQGSAATIHFEKFKGFAGSTFHFELDEAGVSPINVSSWAQLADAIITIDGSSYTGGAASIPLINSTNLMSQSSSITVTGLENRGYTVQVVQDVSTDDVTLVVGIGLDQTWTGNAAADDWWTTAGNWSLGTIPAVGSTVTIDTPDIIDITSDAVIPSGSTVSLLDGTLEIDALADLDLESGSVLNVVGGSITRDASWVTGNNLKVGSSGVSSLLDISSGSIQFTAGSVTATVFYSDLTISGGDIDNDTQTRIYGTLTIQGRAATIDFDKLKGFGSSAIHFELDGVGVSPIDVSSWAQLANASISIDASAYTGGEATIPLINSTNLMTLSSDVSVTGLPSPYVGMVEQDMDTDDVTLVIVDGTTDTDSDGLVDIMEFAFGTDPDVNDGEVMTVNGSSFTPGTPGMEVEFGPLDVKARFIRRTDYASVGFTYTAQFSHDMSTWEDLDGSTAVRISGTLESDGYEAVELSYPVFITNGRKAQFYRMQID